MTTGGVRWVLLLLVCSAGLVSCEDDAARTAKAAAEGGAGGEDGSLDSGGSELGVSGGAGAPGAAGSSNPTGPNQFLPLYENGTRLRAVSLGEANSTTRRFVTWYDSELETECSFLVAEDGKLRCLPRAQSLGQAFADAECNEAVFYDGLVKPCETQPGFRHEPVELASCGGNRVMRLEQVELSEVYPVPCAAEPLTLGAGTTVWRDVAPMAASEFVAATTRERLNQDGFGVVELIADDGARQVLSMHDERYGSCTRREVAEGGLRCLPPVAFRDSAWWFADDACTAEPLAYGVPDDCGQPLQYSFGLDVMDRGDELPLVVSLGERVEGAVYEQSFTTELCEERASSEVAWSLYPLGEPFDIEQLLPLSARAQGSGRFQTYLDGVADVPLSYVPGYNGALVLFDADADQACTAVRFADGDWTCLTDSTGRGELYYYSDDTCQTPVVEPADPAAELFAVVERTFCVREGFADQVVAVRQIGAAYSGALFTKAGGADCLPSDQVAAAGSFELGPDVQDALPVLVEERE